MELRDDEWYQVSDVMSGATVPFNTKNNCPLVGFQTLPVVPGGTCQQVVAASLCRGNLWRNIKFFYLRHNMCLGHSEADDHHAQWLLQVGAGVTMDNNDMIQVP